MFSPRIIPFSHPHITSMKTLTISLLAFLSLTTALGQRSDSAAVFHKKAFQSFNANNFQDCFSYSEKLFATGIPAYRNNYNLYRASVSACQVGRVDKAYSYFKEMSESFLDFYNYPAFVGDSAKISCLSSTPLWKDAMSFMKKKYDSVQHRMNEYVNAINDTSKRLNRSILSDSGAFAQLTSGSDFSKIYTRLKNFNSYSEAPQKGCWTLYHFSLNDTLQVPYLVYIPAKYQPRLKTALYIYLQGAVSNRPEFSIEEPLFAGDRIYLKKPIEQNAFILYPLARKDINWLYHKNAFKVIANEIAFVKSLYNIDDNKVYVTGHSDGGRGVFYLAINQPTQYAAFLALNFFPQTLIGNTALRNLKRDNPFFGISGTADNLFKYSKVDSIYQFAKNLGANWHNYSFPKGHGLPIEAPELMEFIYDTLIAHTRTPFSKSIEWEADDISNGRYQWIEIAKIDTTHKDQTTAKEDEPEIMNRDNTDHLNFYKNKRGMVRATISGNTVTIKTVGVTKINFYVYPEIVDTKKPINFDINGKTFFKVVPQVAKEDMVDEFAKTKDRSMIPIEKITLSFELPAN